MHDAPVFTLAIDAGTGYIFAGDSRGGVWRGSADGKTWTRVGLDKVAVVTLAVTPHALADKSPATVFAGTSSQGVYVSRDSGQTWQQLAGDIAPFVQAIAIHPAEPHDILVATSNGLYVRAPDK